MKNTLGGLAASVVVLALLCICPATAFEKPKGKKADDLDKASIWMTKKLEFSQKILVGLTRGDFDLVHKNADAMLVVGYLERWDRADLPEYKKQLNTFESANKELLRHADKKDITAATKAYAKLMTSCVECHVVVRDAKKK